MKPSNILTLLSHFGLLWDIYIPLQTHYSLAGVNCVRGHLMVEEATPGHSDQPFWDHQ